jgi:hypothetical protein
MLEVSGFLFSACRTHAWPLIQRPYSIGECPAMIRPGDARASLKPVSSHGAVRSKCLKRRMMQIHLRDFHTLRDLITITIVHGLRRKLRASERTEVRDFTYSAACMIHPIKPMNLSGHSRFSGSASRTRFGTNPVVVPVCTMFNHKL